MVYKYIRFSFMSFMSVSPTILTHHQSQKGDMKSWSQYRSTCERSIWSVFFIIFIFFLFLLWPLAKPVLPAFHTHSSTHTLRHFSTFVQKQQQQNGGLKCAYIYALSLSLCLFHRHIRDWKFLCRRKILVFYLFVYSSLAFRNICIPPQLQIYFFAKTHTRKKIRQYTYARIFWRFALNSYALSNNNNEKPNKPLCSPSQWKQGCAYFKFESNYFVSLTRIQIPTSYNFRGGLWFFFF